ncbi:MAG: Xylose isomerase domain protein barrel [Subtercola sp.]|jgi:sugar phosphate isomerase/epimerase|nr:Xylose isomerase domain protein barrel [Subtercola sp.]
MKLGILSAAFPTLTLDEVSDWASREDYQAVELAVWPADHRVERRYAGTSHIDVVGLDRATADRIVGDLAAKGLTISALAYYPNPLDPDPDVSRASFEHLRHVVRAAELLGVPVVGTFAGRDKNRSLDENFDTFAAVWPDMVHFAGDHGVKIAIENCPMIFSADEWPGGTNIAYSPANWRRMFEIIPDDNFGLNFDPSHLVWQFIDIPRAVREFGERIFHVHAKDLEVRTEGLFEQGVMSAGVGWQVPRLCGLGQIDWGAFFGALYSVGYDYVASIEHEDRAFEGSVETVQRGFAIAHDTLRPFIH